jgi:eukaryotic-like serine/threonine-protein kinase
VRSDAGTTSSRFVATNVSNPYSCPAVNALPFPTLGKFRLCGVLGAGGMGVVYDAVQDQPHRSIALKVIRAELASPEMLRRFVRESEVLGRLQHAGIAQIYEAGTAESPDGPQPYFAMELVRGVSLTSYGAQSCATDRERLELFAQVCDAVHYAHQRGVIHRDLKPPNILVNADGEAKVLDFGVARITDADAQHTRATEVGQIVGTLQYMSPEQVSGDPLDVDTRTDVYSLGVILYELLAGRPPYDLSTIPILAAINIIVRVDPPLLGRRERNLKGDVETIVAKAMEKDKERRYGSAAALAADIRRFLRDEPITARPVSTAYQLRKFTRRHRGLVGGIAVAVLVLIAGSVVSAVLAVRARAAEASAIRGRQEAQSARVLADQRRVDAETQRATADTARADALRQRALAIVNATQAHREAAKARAVSSFLTDMLGSADPNVAQGRALTVKDVADQAVTKLRDGRLSNEPDVRSDVHLTLGTTYFAVSEFDSALTQLDSAYSLRVGVSGRVNASAVDIEITAAKAREAKGDLTGAERQFRDALATSRRLNPPHPELTIKALGGLAILAQFGQREAQAETLATEALAVARRSFHAPSDSIAEALESLAEVTDYNGKQKAAEPLWRETLEMRRRLHGERHTTTLNAMYGLGYNMYRRGDYPAAEAMLRPALAGMRTVFGSSDTKTVSALEWLATSIANQGRRDEADPMMREVLATRLRVLGEDHLDVQLVRTSLARSLSARGNYAEAESLLLAALAGRTRVLGPRHGGVASSLSDLAELADARGDLPEAERRYRESLPLWREGKIERMELTITRNLASVLAREGKLDEADRLLRDALPHQRAFSGDVSADVALATSTQAMIAARQGRLQDADSLYGVAVDIRRRVFGERNINVANSLAARAGVREQRGDTASAEAFLREAVDITRTARPAADPTLRNRLSQLGQAQCAVGRLADGEASLRSASAAAPNATMDSTSARARSALGDCFLREHRYAEAEPLLLEAEAATRERTDASRRLALSRLILLYEQWGRSDEAAKWRSRRPN